MVAIFTGAGAGFERGSGSVLGGSGLLGSSSLGRGGEQLFLNAATGNLLISRQDEFLVGRGPDVAIARTYNSLVDVGDDNNDNWRQSTDRRVFGLTGTLNSTGSTIKRVSGDGSVITYSWNGSAYLATDGSGAHDTLTHGAGIWTWTDGSSQITETYAEYPASSGNWRITTQADTDGNALTFTYTSDKLTRIATANGEYVDYTWSGANITAIVTQAGGTLTRTRYAYDGNNRLTSVTTDLTPDDNSIADCKTYTTAYTYHGTSNRIATISQTDGSYLAIAYDASNRVSTLTQTASSGVTRVTTLAYGAGYTTITDPTGQTTRLDYASGNFAAEVETWGSSNLDKEPATIDGAPATKFTVQTTGWAAISQAGDAAAGDTVTFGLTLQAVGSVTSQSLGIYGYVDDWGTRGTSSARIVSGPGQLIQAGGGLWTITGLSTTQGTRIEITRTFTQAQAYSAFLYGDHPGGYRAGTSLVAADASLVQSSTAARLDQMDLGDNWLTARLDRTSVGTVDAMPAYQYTAQGGGTTATYGNFAAKTGDTFTFSVSLQAVGSDTSQQFGLYGNASGWGANQAATARIVSGPGTITQTSGGRFLITGLSTTQATRIEVTRTYTQDETGSAYIYVDYPAFDAGSSLIAAGPHLVRQIASGTANQLVKITTAAPQTGVAAQVVEFGYNDAGDLVTVKDASGNTTTYTYDANGNLLTTMDRLGNVVTRTYGSKNELLTETRTGSDMSYAANTHTARFVYDDENHLIYTVSADGRVQQYWYNANGELYWINDFPDQAYNVTGLGTSTPLTHSQLDTWVSGLGDTSSSQISYMLFDARGNLLQRTRYAEPLDHANGALAGGYQEDYFTYDQAGQLLSRYTTNQNHETFLYDGLGRLTASTDVNGGTTSFVFNDSATQTVVTLANGLIETSTYNQAGELISFTQSGDFVLNPTSTSQYDKNGRLRVHIDATGNNYFFLYDKLGRKIADVNQFGDIVEYRYDANNRLVATAHYAVRLTEPQLTALADPNADIEIASIRPVSHALDLWTWTVHDKEGRVIEAIGGDGSVTAYDYDASGQLVRTTAYKNKLTALQVAGFVASSPTTLILPTSDANDSVARNFYDRDGLLVGVLDGEGYLTSFSYDKAGRKILDYAYATATNPAQRASGSFWDLATGLSGATDRRTWYVYDGQGHLRYVVDPINRVTEYGYVSGVGGDATGLVRTVTQYAGTISVPVTPNYALIKAAVTTAGLVSNPDNRVSYNVYDEAGRLAYAIDATGAVTGHVYDNMGQVTRTVRYTATYATSSLPDLGDMDSWSATHGADAGNRFTRFYYSDRGELVFTVDAEGYVTRFQYDAEGRKARESRYDDAISVTDSTTALYIDSIAIGTAAETIYYYHATGQLAWVFDGEGVGTYYSYWGTGQLAYEYRAYGTSDQSITAYVYDNAGQLITRYDAHTSSVEAITQFAYDGLGNLIKITDAGGHQTTMSYDRVGQMLSKTDALGGSTDYQYNAFGEVASVADAEENTTYNYYDRLGRLIVNRDAENYLTETSYTAFGEVASVRRRYNRTASPVSLTTVPTATAHAKDATTSFEYDRLGRLVKTIDAEGFYEEYTLNALGERIQVRNKLGGISTYSYDRRGLLTDETLPMASYTAAGAVEATTVTNHYVYDARGNRLQSIEAYGLLNNRTTSYVYDALDRVVAIYHDDVESISTTNYSSAQTYSPVEYFSYDKRGNLISKTNVYGARELYYYDLLDRVTEKIVQDRAGGLGTYYANTYSVDGTLSASRVYATQVNMSSYLAGGTAPTAPSGAYRETTYTYDALHRMLTSSVASVRTGAWNGTAYATNVGAVTTTYTYDSIGNVVKTVDGAGATTYAYYDNLGRQIAAVDAENYLTTWSRDAEGNVLFEHRYANRATGPYLVETVPAASSDLNDRTTTFTYDRNGRRLTETRENAFTWGIKPNGQLTTVSSESTVQFQYNGLGEVTSKTEATGDQTAYTYDLSGRLILETRPGFKDFYNNDVIPTVHYYYDGLGSLMRTVQGGASPSVDDRITTYSYKHGLMTGMTAADGGHHDYHYDVAGNLLLDFYTRLSSSGSATIDGILYARDLAGRAVSQRSSTYSSGWVASEAQTTSYNAFGEVVSRGYGGLTQESFAYDNLGQLVATNSQDGVQRFFVYDGAGHQTLMMESEGTDLTGLSVDQAITTAKGAGATVGAQWVDGINATITVYDQRGLATQAILPHRETTASSRSTFTSSASYNAFGETVSATDARGYTTNYSYNTMGRMILQEDPSVSYTSETGAVASARPTTTYYYDPSGRQIGMKDANGHTTIRRLLAGTGYDGGEALVSWESHPDGGIAQNGYDVFGDLRRKWDEINRQTDFAYDEMGRLITKTSPGGLVDHYTYDLLGQRLTHWNSLLGSGNAETADYDRNGRITSMVAFGGDTTTISYTWSSAIATTGMDTYGGWTQTTTYANSKTLVETSDYFGHATGKTDLGGHAFSYSYDFAGRLTAQSGAEARSYQWLNTGLLAGTSVSAGDLSTYTYDAGGNRLTEYTLRNSVVVQNATTTYDALNRMVTFSEAGSTTSPAATIAWEYDLNGNIRRSNASYRTLSATGAASGTASPQDNWYRYDAMNRVVTEKGKLSGGAITRGNGGTEYLYNAAGERVRAVSTEINYTYTPIILTFFDTIHENYTYNADGSLIEVRIARSDTYEVTGGVITGIPPTAPGDVRSNFTYDAMGRLTRQTDWLGNGTNAGYDRYNIVYNAKGQITSETTATKQGADTWVSTITNTYGSGGTYALGAILTTTTSDAKNGVYQYATTTTNSYAWYDGAVQSSLTYAKTSQPTYTTTYTLSGSGQLTSAYIGDGRPRTVSFVNDLDGQVLRRDEADGNGATGDPHEVWYRFGGRQLGFTGNNGTIETRYQDSVKSRTAVAGTGPFRSGAATGAAYGDFSQALSPINSYAQGGGGGSYVAQAGDTLAGIAAALWGDASLWYKLAEANGLSGASGLAEGQRLTVPAGVMRSTHNAATFKPYDPADAIGELSPVNPKPTKKQNKCGAFGAILLAVVAVAVTVVTAGAAVAALGPAGTSLGAGISTVLGTAGGIGVGAVAAGTGISTGAFLAAGVAGGIVGSIASQGLGVATGLQDKFSWKGVALAGLSAGIGGGLGTAGLGSGFLGAAVRGAVGSALTQGVAVATGLSSKFDWAGVAAAGIGGGIANLVGRQFPKPNFGETLITNAAGGIANAAARTLANGSSFGDNLIAALPDVIGSTVGNWAAGAFARSGGPGGGKGMSSKADVSAAEGGSDKIVITNTAGWMGRRESASGFTGAFAQARQDRIQDLLAAAHGDRQLAADMIRRSRGVTLEEVTGNTASAVAGGPTTIHVLNDGNGRTYDGRPSYTTQEYWNEGMTSFGGVRQLADGTYTWVENAEVMRQVNADLAQLDRQIGLLGLAMVGGGAGGAAVSLLAPLAGLGEFGTGALAFVGDSFVGGGVGVPMRAAFGEANNIRTFLTDTAFTAVGGLVFRGVAWGFGRIGSGEVAIAAEGEVLSPFTQRYLTESGGRWGGTATRQQNYAISQELEARGYSFPERPGGGLGPEEYIAGSGSRGGTYVDITGIAPNGRTVRIQTVTTLADGVTPTASEAVAAARIRAAFPNDKLLLVPKR